MPDKRVTELDAIDTVTGTDLVMVIDNPSVTPINKKATVNQVLVDVARTNTSNTFTGDQTVDGDLFVTGEVNPTVLARQLPKINQLTGEVGDPSGSRTLMSQSLISGLSLRHDEDIGHGRVAVGNYDTQTYQPLLFEIESFQIHTGVSPGVRLERVRVHPGGGVTVGTVHTTDPGAGVLQADGLGTTPLDATKLVGTIPAAQLPPKPFRQGHTWGLVGDVSALTTLPGVMVPMVGTQMSVLVGLRAKLGSGTSVGVQVQRNGVNVGSVITVTTTATTTSLLQPLLADDELALVLSAPVGTPSNLGATLILEHTP